MALTGEQLENAILALVPTSGGAADASAAKDIYARKTVALYYFNDNNTAATDAIEAILWSNNTGVNYKVVGVKVVTINAVTSNDTNYKIWTVYKRMVATPGTQTAICAPTTQTTGIAAGLGTTVGFKSVDAPAGAYTAANLIVAAGDVLTCQTTHGGSGVATTGATGTVSGAVIVYLEPV